MFYHLIPGSSLPLALWLGVLLEVNTPHLPPAPCIPQTVQMVASPYCAHCVYLQPFLCLAYLLLVLDFGKDPSYISVLAECLAL